MFSLHSPLSHPEDDLEYDDVVITGALSASSPSALRLPPSPLLASSTSSPASSSSFSSSPSSSSSADSDTCLGLTDNSAHCFPTFAALRSWMVNYATTNGFEVRWRASGGEGSAHHGGTIRCWCFEKPPATVKVEVISSTAPLRIVHTKTSSRGGKQVKCGCDWYVNFYRHADGEYHITTRKLTHSGHEVVNPSALTDHIDSMRNLPTEVQQAVELMIRNGMHGIESERRYLQALHKLTIDREVFRNFVKKTKRQMGILDSSDDFKQLLYWLQNEMANKAALARMRVAEDDCRVEAVFYMSADMIHNLDRNGVVLAMDTTFKTNRFHWPLLLVCGVNEHFQTILLAVALVHHQTTDSFSWVLDQMKLSVSEATWDGVATIITDGDAAMAAALLAKLPGARHLRCRYHLETNLRDKLLAPLGLIPLEKFITAWKGVVHEETESGFKAAKADLHRSFPAAVAYLEKWHWPHERQFAECYLTDTTTLGLRSTARVESWNSLLKGMLAVNSSTSLSVLFQSLQFAASEVDRRAVRRAAEEAARVAKPIYQRTVEAETRPHLTHYAVTKLMHQFELQHNYQHAPKAYAGADTVWYVWDARPVDDKPEEKREVRAKEDFMHCSCGYPTTHLLPCRHVLHINLHLYNYAFQRRQISQRWLKYYKPLSVASTAASDPPLPLPTAIPSFNSALVQVGIMPARQARHGTLMGYCNTICTRAAEYTDIYHEALKKVEELARWVEAQTSKTGLDIVSRPSPSSSSPFSSPTVQPAVSSLHASVGIEQVAFPEHRKKPKGRPAECRQKGVAERAEGKKARLSASQMS
jgi:hypothetical protein